MMNAAKTVNRFPRTVVEAVLGLSSYLQGQFASLADIYMPIEGITEKKTNQEFVYRQTSNTIKAKELTLDRIKGKTLAWNQLIKNGDFSDGTNNWSVYNESAATISVSGGILTQSIASGTSYANYEYALNQYNVFKVQNHRYLLTFVAKADTSLKLYIEFGGGFVGDANVTTSWQEFHVLNTRAQYNAGLLIYPSIAERPVNSHTIQYADIYCTDLTLLYGSEIDGLTDAQILAKYEAEYGGYHGYNAGELKSNDAKQIETVGRNLWDEEIRIYGKYTSYENGNLIVSDYDSTGFIPIIGGQPYYYELGTTGGEWGAYYDANKNYISGDSQFGASTSKIKEAPANARYVCISLNPSVANSTVIVNLSDSSFNGQYEPYTKSVLPLNLDSIDVISPNIWDEQWVNGHLNENGVLVSGGTTIASKNFVPVEGGATYYIKAPTLCYVCFYDANQTFISSQNSLQNTTFTTPANCAYIKFNPWDGSGYYDSATYKNDLTVNISSPAFNGRYFPHGILTIEGGLKGAGSVYDEIRGEKLYRRVGSVNLATINWGYSDGAHYMNNFQNYAIGIKMPTTATSSGNAISQYYEIGSDSEWTSGKFYLSYTGQAGRTAAQNDPPKGLLYYELTNVEVYDLASPIPVSMPAGTTEERISPNADGLSAPFCADITYGMAIDNYAETAGVALNAISTQFAEATARLLNARTIWGQSFDGSQNITGALSGVTNIDSLAYFDTTNGRIGIGTSSPSYTLHVSGTFKANGNSEIGGSLIVGSDLAVPYNAGLNFYGSGDLWMGSLGLNSQGNALVASFGIGDDHVLLHDGNYGSYALPISGGTLTGPLGLLTHEGQSWNVERGESKIRFFANNNTQPTGAPGYYMSGVSLMTNYNGFQFATYAGNDNDLYFRKMSDWVSGYWMDWCQIWNSANDGSGSGLDADLLDGKHDGEITAKNIAVKVQGSETYYDMDTALAGGGLASTWYSFAKLIWGHVPTDMMYGNIWEIAGGEGVNTQLAFEVSNQNHGYGRIWHRSGNFANANPSNNWRQLLTDDGAGRFGIGTTTPSYLLDVNGVARAKYFRSDGELKSSQQFTFRQTAAGTLSWNPNAANFKALYGKSLAWNQLVDINGSTDANVSCSGGKITTTAGTAAQYNYVAVCPSSLHFIAGHKYCVIGASKWGSLDTTHAMQVHIPGGVWSGASVMTSDGIYTAELTVDNNVYLFYESGTVFPNATLYIQIVDLTLAFGSGNEPATVAEFQTLYPGVYPYNPGELRSVTAKGVKTVGFNLWDEEWESGSYDDYGEKAVNPQNFRNKNAIKVIGGKDYYFKTQDAFVWWYDSNMNLISGTIYVNDSILTSPANAAWMNFYVYQVASYSNDICINKSDSSRNGTYEPYKETYLPLNLDEIKVKSPNVWDEEWELGYIDTETDGSNITSTDRIRSKNYLPVVSGKTYYYKQGGGSVGPRVAFYDANKTFVSGTTVGALNNTFVVPNNAAYMRFSPHSTYGSTYNHDICINLSDPAFNGKYFPHGTITISGGLKGAGNVCDEIRGGKLIRRVGRVDLGTMSWDTYQNANSTVCFGGGGIQDYAKPVADNSVSNSVCSIFEVKSRDAQWGGTSDKVIAINHGGGVYVNAFSYNGDVTAFTAAMSGVMFDYELKYEEVYDLAEPLDLSIRVDALGTEAVVSDDIPSAPMKADIQYGITDGDIANDMASMMQRMEFLANNSEAVKLKSAHTIWGQSFDGTQDVTGALSGVTNINSKIYFSGSNVGISQSSPQYGLDIAGTLRATGNVTFGGSITAINAKSTLHSIDSIPVEYDSEAEPVVNVKPFEITDEGYGTFMQLGTLGLLKLYSYDNEEHDFHDTSLYYDYSDDTIVTDSSITAYSFIQSSDQRLKTDLAPIGLTVEQIADAPAMEFKWKGNGQMGAGSIAQYWEEVLPYNVHETGGTLSMEYGNIALLSAITLAREVQRLGKEIEELKARLQ